MCDNETAEAIVCAIQDVAVEVEALDDRIHEAAIEMMMTDRRVCEAILEYFNKHGLPDVMYKFMPKQAKADVDAFVGKLEEMKTLENAYDVVAKRVKKKRKRKN